MLLASAISTSQPGMRRAPSKRLETLVGQQPDNIRRAGCSRPPRWAGCGDAKATIATLARSQPGRRRRLCPHPDRPGLMRNWAIRIWRPAFSPAPRNRQVGRRRRPWGGRVRTKSSPARESASARAGEAGPQVQLIRALPGGAWATRRWPRRAACRPQPGGAGRASARRRRASASRRYAAAVEEYRRRPTSHSPNRSRFAWSRHCAMPGTAAALHPFFLQQNPQTRRQRSLPHNESLLQAGQWARGLRSTERLRARMGNRDATLLNNLAWAYRRGRL